MTDYLSRIAARAHGEARAPHALQPRPVAAFESPPAEVAAEHEAELWEPASIAAAPASAAQRSVFAAAWLSPAQASARREIVPGPSPGPAPVEEPRVTPSWMMPAPVERVPPSGEAIADAGPAESLAEPLDGPRAESLAEPLAESPVESPAIASPSLRRLVAAALGPRPAVPSTAPAPNAPQSRRRAAQAAASQLAPSGDQVVQVTIGRIDVRSAAAPPPVPPPPREPMLTLAEYLRGGKR